MPVNIGTDKSVDLPNSPYARELEQTRLFRLRFEPGTETEFAISHLQRTRGRVRAWHSIVLAMYLLLILPDMIALRFGGSGTQESGPFADSWNPGNADMLFWVVVIITLSRAALAFVAWTRLFERWYPRIALPLVMISHGLWAFMCSGEMLGAHPEYLAPLVTDAFAAFFFSGLLFRQALLVNAAAVGALFFGGWYHTGIAASMVGFGVHLIINAGIAAVAGFAHERSERTRFLEHSLLGEMAARDGLTGLKNRRAFDEHLTRVWQQALRDRRTLGVLMIDADDFKKYNDRYGHQAGDNALKRIARAVEELARRPLDIAARYGGEELVVVLYDMSKEHILELAERVRRTVQELGIAHEASTAGVITVSVGVGIVSPTLQRSPQGAVQLADQALYQAKQAGRNRVVFLDREHSALTTGIFKHPARDGGGDGASERASAC